MGGTRAGRGVQSEPNATMLRRARTKTGTDPNSGMTPLSRATGAPAWIRSAPRLARGSLFAALMALVSAGCVDSPPTYTAPVRSPPIILGNLVTPSTHQVYRFKLDRGTSSTIQPLNVPFRSIDAGEPLISIFWVDYDPNQPNLGLLDAPPVQADSRPLDEQDRSVTFNWDTSPFAGCHTVTMVLAHASTYPSQLEPPRDENDIGQVTWFFDVQDQSVPAEQRPVCWPSLQ